MLTKCDLSIKNVSISKGIDFYNLPLSPRPSTTKVPLSHCKNTKNKSKNKNLEENLSIKTPSFSIIPIHSKSCLKVAPAGDFFVKCDPFVAQTVAQFNRENNQTKEVK